MQVRVLGSLDVTSERGLQQITGEKQRVLLQLLALRIGEVVTTDELIEAGWGDDLPSNPPNALQYQVARLRKRIEPTAGQTAHLLTEPSGYRLDAGSVTTDVAQFRALAAAARTAFDDDDLTGAAETIDEALALWRGQPLVELTDRGVGFAEAERLRSEQVAARELRVDIALAAGDHASVVPELVALTSDHPLHEGLWAKRTLALYQDGQQSAALRVVGEARAALAEVGLEPSFELRDLERRIFDEDESLVPAAPDRLAPNNLTAPPNPLIGRDADVAETLELLDRARSVTLIGPGGAGKTRIAAAVATAAVDRFPGGVWFVALDTLADETLLAAEVGRVSRMREVPSSSVLDTLASHLDGSRTLLVLDNCEHLVAAVAEIVEELTTRCRSLSVLATSQVTLDTSGEVVAVVQPLALPGETNSIYDSITDSSAAKLFVERARAAGADVDGWGDDDLATVANIVAALDGLPLALELAAARSRSMSLDEIALGLDDRFSTLSRGPRTAPDRQRSLLGAVEWSLGLLDERQRDLVARLGVLAGGFDTADAAAVVGAPVATVRDDLADLVDRSLLIRRGEATGTARFAMLESLRHHGEFSVGQRARDEARDRHAAHFAALVRDADRGVCGPDQVEWLQRIDAAYDNIRVAMTRCLDGGDVATGVRMAGDLGRYWDWRGLLKEASSWTSRFIDRATEPMAGLASVMAWQGYGSFEFGDLDTARNLVDRALDIARGRDDPAEIAGVLTIKLLISRSLALLEEARRNGDDLVRAAERAGDPWLVAWSASALSTVDVAAGDTEAAAARAARSRDLFAELGDRRGEAWALITLSQTALDSGDLDRADRRARAALERAVELEDDRDVLWVLELLVQSAYRRGDFARSARVWGAAQPRREQRGLNGSVSKLSEPSELDADLRAALGGAFDEHVERGRADPDQVIADELRAGHTASPV